MTDLPQKEDILRLLSDSAQPISKREIVRAFGIKGDERRGLKDLLRKLENDGVIIKHPGGAYALPKGLPSVIVAQVYEIDIDGDVFARPTEWDEALLGDAPRIELVPDKKGHPALKEGDRVLVSTRKFTDKLYEGKILRRLDDPRGQILGEVIKIKKGFVLKPTNKKAKYDFDIPQKDLNEAQPGDLAVGEIQPARGARRKQVRIIEVIGSRDDPKAISLIALHEAGLHERFPETVIEETQDMKVPPLGKREDLRRIPLVTIDGADARDFDDAVFAEKLEDGTYHLIVAIADVAFYVRPGKPLDSEAYRRGNSTYFPDRVVPMLPEALSNDLCSLRPKEDRACMAFHLWIDEHGNLKKHKIVRGLMRSAARLIYEQVQYIYDTNSDSPSLREGGRGRVSNAGQSSNIQHPHPTPQEGGSELWPIIEPLYEAYDILDKARQKRGALDLDLPERQILINDQGEMTGVKPRARLDAHKLIEEFMILANVAAAQALEAKKAPCVYRVHDRPSTEKLDSAREFLDAFGLTLPTGGVAKPAQINHLLRKASEMEYSHLVSEVILRTQSQAIYHPENIGHFGLALSKYAHFTSPIRRYADLLVHRSLIRAYGLGEGGLDDVEAVTLEEKAEHISQTERTSMEAERAAMDRFTASWMANRIGAEFAGRINGVTRFGLFVTLDETGADGLIPMRSLANDFYVHDEHQHALIGRRHGRIYRLGAPVMVRVVEADKITGSSVFELASDESADIPGIKFARPKGLGGETRKKGKAPKKQGKSSYKGPRKGPAKGKRRK